MATVLVFTTGGTIASQRRSDGDVLVDLDGKDIVDALRAVRSLGAVEVVELGRLPGTALEPATVFDWALQVDEQLAREDVAGAVVTMGTVALEECSYLFDLRLSSAKPVVFTGAMRMPGHISPDGPVNLAASIAVAREERLADYGVVVVMNDELHAAREVTKTHTRSVDAFRSPCSGPIGRVVDHGEDLGYQLSLERRPVVRERILAPRLEHRVGYVTAVLGCGGGVIDSLVESGIRGIVVEALGEGSATTAMAPAIEGAIAKDVVVVVASRACGGTLPAVYTALGESKWLLDRGVLFAGTLTGPKARMKLMLALGLTEGRDVAQFFPANA